MAITLGVHASAGSSNGNSATTPARVTTPGSAVFVQVAGDTGATYTVTDNKGNTFHQEGTTLSQSSAGYASTAACFYAENIAGGSGHTFTVTASGRYPTILVQEILGSSVVKDQFAQGNDTATPYVAGPITPTADGCAVMSGIGMSPTSNPAYVIASPLTKQEQVNDVSSYFAGAIAGYVQGSAAAIAPSWSATGNPAGVGQVCVMSFKETGAPSSITGTAAITTANATVSSTAKLAIAGAVAITTAAATMISASSLPITGALAASTADATISAAAQLQVRGTAVLTTADATISAQGSLPLAGQVAVTTQNATVSAQGSLPLAGQVAVTTQDSTLASNGTLALSGNLAITTDAAVVVSASSDNLHGNVNVSTADSTLSANGELGPAPNGGSLAVTTQPATLSALASLSTRANMAVTLADATINAFGSAAVSGSVDAATADAVLSAYGYSGTPVEIVLDTFRVPAAVNSFYFVAPTRTIRVPQAINTLRIRR